MLSFGYLSIFPSVFSYLGTRFPKAGKSAVLPGSRRQGKGHRGICKQWPLLRQLFPARRIWELVELLPGTFPSPCTPAPSPLPLQKHQLSFVWQHKVLPRQGAAGRTPAAKITFLPHPSLLGGGDQREHTGFSRKRKSRCFGHEKICGFVENSFLVLLPLQLDLS